MREDIISAVPQASKLGPILLNTVMADMRLVIDVIEFANYTYDYIIYCSNGSVYAVTSLAESAMNRSIRPEVFCKKLFLEIWQNSQENTCVIKIGTLTKAFSCEFCEIFKNTFLIKNTADGYLCKKLFQETISQTTINKRKHR